MAALDRPTHAFDGTPVAGMKRAAKAATGGSTGADPRSEGGPTRSRSKLRSDFSRRSSSEEDTAPIDRPDVDPTPAGTAAPDIPFDWVQTDTALHGVLSPSLPATEPPSPTTDEVTTVGPIVPMVRSTTVITDTPLPTGLVPLVVTPAEPAPEPAARPAGRQITTRTSAGRAARPRVRRVRRVVRSIDTWTVFKLSVLFYLVLYAVLLVAGVLLWNLAYATGTIDNLENFFESFGWETFRFNGGEIFHSAWIAGLFLVGAGTGLNVVAATVFNLMADLVGGVGVTVLEEEVRVVPDTEVGSRRRGT